MFSEGLYIKLDTGIIIMKPYTLVLLNIGILLSSIVTAYLLSNVYPGKIKDSSAGKGNVAKVEVLKRYRAFLQSAYILAVLLLVDSLDLLGEKVTRIFNLPPSFIESFAIEEHYIDAWLIFWSGAVSLYFLEWIIRLRYKKAGRLFPISALISQILRCLLLSSFALWVAHFVLNWPSHQILISTTVFAAFGVIAMKSTLGDLLSGISLHLSRSILPSQWIDLIETPIKGEVISTNWRETRVRSTDGYIHVVPNALIAAKPFHNMSWPDSLRRHNLNFYLTPNHSFKEIEQILLAATEGQDKVLQSPKPPQVILKAFLEFGVHYQIRFWSTTFHDKASLESEIYTKALEGLQEKDIELAYTLEALIKR